MNGWCCCWDCVETNGKMIEAEKEFLEKMWRDGCRENYIFLCVYLFVIVFYRSCRYKGLALERSRATCNIKIKIKIRI